MGNETSRLKANSVENSHKKMERETSRQKAYPVENSHKVNDSDFLIANYYSPGKQMVQFFRSNKEGFTIPSKIELRTRASPLKPGTFEIGQGQLCSKVESEYYVGSGTLCSTGRSWNDGFAFVLTCAHNFVHISTGLSKKVAHAESIRYDYVKDGPNKYALSAQVVNYHIYPGYLEDWSIFKGNDLAIGILESGLSLKSLPISENSFWSSLEDEDAQPGDKIMVTGYPGEMGCYLYYMEGTIKDIVSRGGRKIICYNDINTTGGQSGSPVYILRNGTWRIIGIHVGYDPSSNVNIATAITKDFRIWLDDIIDQTLKNQK